MIKKDHNHKLQTSPWHREEESHNNHEIPGTQTKQSNQLFLPQQDDCKTRKNTKQRTQNPTMRGTINNESTTTEPPP